MPNPVISAEGSRITQFKKGATRMKATKIAITNTVLAVFLILGVASPSRAQWPTAHGSPANTGFARVDTLPATVPAGYANVGKVAPGANPVVAPDGTVYIGNLAGELIALHPDGSPYWSRKLNAEHGAIFASPAVAADGSIYVVSSLSYRDPSDNAPLFASFLHKFSPGGGWIFWRPFPKAGVYPFRDGGATTAPPNIWAWNGVEAIITPVFYTGLGRGEVRLIAFSPDGGVIGKTQVTLQVYEITTETDFVGGLLDLLNCIRTLACGFSNHLDGSVFPAAGWPQPGVAIWEYAQGSPYIWLADGIRSTVAYKFDPAAGFSEIYRFSDSKDRLSSPPLALDNVVAVVGVGAENGRLKFERDNTVIPGLGAITAAPTRTNDGRLVVIERPGTMSVFSSHALVMRQPLNGPSIASAAASCTHLFISTTEELVTFDVRTMVPVARLPWTDGGRQGPVIGPLGHVYAMTNWGLFVFAAPKRLPVTKFSPYSTACDSVAWRVGVGIGAP
jgi:hypothetical protein